jgi:hypothetical protein
MNPVESIALFPNPNTPDLGCFVRRKHGFETDPDVDCENLHLDFSPSIDFSPPYHQTYFRVSCGDTSFFQRCLVYMTTAAILPSEQEDSPPNFILGGDYTPYPSDWSRFPTQAGTRIYWFFGQFSNPATQLWLPDALVRHSYDIYENGTLSTVQYSDLGARGEFDDFVLEVAIVGRRSWANLPKAPEQAKTNRIIQEKGIPRLVSLLNRLGD